MQLEEKPLAELDACGVGIVRNTLFNTVADPFEREHARKVSKSIGNPWRIERKRRFNGPIARVLGTPRLRLAENTLMITRPGRGPGMTTEHRRWMISLR